MPKQNTSGFTGVSRNPKTNLWQAQIHIGGKYIGLGSNYKSARKAMLARRKLLNELNQWISPVIDGFIVNWKILKREK